MGTIVTRWTVFFLAGIFLLLNLCVPGAQAQKVIKLGWSNPLTGPAGAWGLMNQAMFEASKTFINKKGGITVKGQNYKYEFIYADDKYTVTGGRAAGEKLIYNDKVHFLVGQFGVEPLAGWAPLAHKEKILAITGGSSILPKPEYPYVFHFSGTNNERSLSMCRVLKEKLGVKSTLYIMTDDLVGRVAQDDATKNREERGLEVKGTVLVPPNTKDFYPFLNQELKSNPDSIQCTLPPGLIALVVKQARELGFKGYIASATAVPADLEKWQGITGVEASKGYIGIMVSREEYSPLGLEFQDLYDSMKLKYKMSDIAYVMMPYVLKVAIEKTQSFDSDQILKVLRNDEFTGFFKVPVKAGGEKTFGIKNHIATPIPYSIITGLGQIKYLGSALVETP